MKMKDRFMCRVCGQTPCNCTSVSEAIKGWKHAHSDLMKMRASQGKDVVLHSLKKDGKESGMHDARKSFKDEDEAHEYHERVSKLNPTKQIRHNLYVDGKLVKTLGEEMELDEAVHSPYRNAAIALRNMSFDPNNSESDRATYSTHADLLHSKDPKHHEASARMAARHDTAVRDEISDAVHRNSSKVNSAKYHKMAGITRLKEETELNEASFAATMKKAIAAHERGDHKMAKYHLDNAKTARYAMKSTEIAKNKDLLDTYKKMRDMHAGIKEEYELEEAFPYNVDHMPGATRHDLGNAHKIEADKAKRREYEKKHVKTFIATKEKEAREYAKQHGHKVVKHSYPAGHKNMYDHEWHILKEESQPTKEATMNPMEMYLAAIAGSADFASTLAEKTLTAAEKKKREEIAQAMERENPGMDKSKKMAIATATAKRVAEEAELAEAAPASLKNHPMWHPNDYKYLSDKGYTVAEIKKLWDRDHAAGKSPVEVNKHDPSTYKEGKEHTIPKTEKEKRLAALAEPKGKITHKDVLVGRGVVKEEELDEAKDHASMSDAELKKHISIHTRNALAHNLSKAASDNLRAAQAELKKRRQKRVAEEAEQLDELSKDTVAKYADRAQDDFAHQDMGSRNAHPLERPEFSRKKRLRRQGIARAVNRLYPTNEETELGEAMISYSDFMDKIAMHRKMGNKVVDHKYTDKKATYTTVDSEGVGKKITHTETGTKQEHLGKIEGKDDEAEVKQPEKRGRGRPAGTKSGARH